MASVGSSHSRLTSAEDNEEASLLGCPPIGLLDGEEFRTMQPSNQEASSKSSTRTIEESVRLTSQAAVVDTRSEERRVGKSVDLGGRRIIKKKKSYEAEGCGRTRAQP